MSSVFHRDNQALLVVGVLVDADKVKASLSQCDLSLVAQLPLRKHNNLFFVG